MVFGAGRSLGQRGNVLGLSFYDLFLGSLTIVGRASALLMAMVIFFPRLVRGADPPVGGGDRAAEPAGGGAAGAAPRGDRRGARQRGGLQQPRAAGWRCSGRRSCRGRPTPTSSSPGTSRCGPSGIHANFVDILLLQTLVMFLLYFAPTPGASGIGEVLSAAVMSSYVPRELTPIYILIWRLILTYFTLALRVPGLFRLGAPGSQVDRPGPAGGAGRRLASCHERRSRASDRGLRRRGCCAGCWGISAPTAGTTAAAVLLSLVQSGLALVGPRLTEHALDVAIPRHDLGLLGLLAAIYFVTLVLDFVVEYGGDTAHHLDRPAGDVRLADADLRAPSAA